MSCPVSRLLFFSVYKPAVIERTEGMQRAGLSVARCTRALLPFETRHPVETYRRRSGRIRPSPCSWRGGRKVDKTTCILSWGLRGDHIRTQRGRKPCLTVTRTCCTV